MSPSKVEVIHEEHVGQIREPEKSNSRTQSADEGSETGLLEAQEERQMIRRIDVQ